MTGTHNVKIRRSSSADLEALFQVWLAAVRATHDFLTEADVAFYSLQVLHEYLPSTSFWVVVDDLDRPIAFLGATENKIDALFVTPAHHGRGVGRALIAHAFAPTAAVRVDVNEANLGAQVFYRRLGFREVGRSALDDAGRPLPLIHLERSASA
jgi:putative acetyltransferase